MASKKENLLPSTMNNCFQNYSSFPPKNLTNSSMNIPIVHNEILQKKLEKKIRLASIRITQSKKKEGYKHQKRNPKQYTLVPVLCKPDERILLEVSPSRGPLITLDSGVVLQKIELVVEGSFFELVKLNKKGHFDSKKYLGSWYPKKSMLKDGELVEYRIEFLNITKLKEFLESKLSKPLLKLENLAFRMTTQKGVSTSPHFEVISRINKPENRFPLFVDSSNYTVFYKPLLQSTRVTSSTYEFPVSSSKSSIQPSSPFVPQSTSSNSSTQSSPSLTQSIPPSIFYFNVPTLFEEPGSALTPQSSPYSLSSLSEDPMSFSFGNDEPSNIEFLTEIDESFSTQLNNEEYPELFNNY